MVIQWLPLLAGLFFGLIPTLRLIHCEVRYLAFDDLWTRLWRAPQNGQKRRRWWKLPLVWIDPVRGYFTGAMLARAFSPAPRASFPESQLPVLALLACLMAVLVVQTTGRTRERESLSPGGFMAGLMLAIMPLQVSLGALVVGLATAIALHRYSFGYWAAALFTAGLGFVFVGKSPMLAVMVTMVSAPAWISWLRGTPLVTPVRC